VSLAADIDAVASQMVQRIISDVPAYASASQTVLDDVLVLATATTGILTQALANHAPVEREHVPLVREHAAVRLRQGVDLESFLHAYRAALFEYWDICTKEAIRLRLSRDASLALAGFVLDAIDTITTHAAEAYLREDNRIVAMDNQEARDLVDILIDGRTSLDVSHHPMTARLATRELVTVVGRLRDADTIASEDALQVARELLEHTLGSGRTRPLSAIRRGEIVLIGAARPSTSVIADRVRVARKRTIHELAVDIRYGIGVTATGLAGIPRAYRDALLSCNQTTAARPVAAIAELPAAHLAVVTADPEVTAVIRARGQTLRGLPPDDYIMTTETIRAFAAADLSVSRAASAMFLHPNTIRYRLERIAATTGHDPRTFSGLVELTCILEALTQKFPREADNAPNADESTRSHRGIDRRPAR
jgi:hypothetical protein